MTDAPYGRYGIKVCILGARSKYNSALKEIIFLFCYVTLLLSNENTSFYS
ncbi:hypothetical protein APHWI1_0289 [Anaplasma phagocytophilum str. ApWI1]|uniref:Uncharacterized protein n=1 Tax=Anaplasma phagocytophilum str. ApWI1 TaxID=1359155 RepID=A0A0F3PXT9_ANAPH|nr:hypothetical protein APHWEB_1226 [Anaplasma phagocytophilum str. Webster]KJV84797.1 hypothetical protein APHWI1_0289 [Anaplasma phagocytophilum str. ApWI1]KJV87273.1 hypothetical protein APHNYW_0801 [Anaplasma phagocytophilum str. ApNYW]KJV98766.1 hypothetical protein OTSANNIE_1062 [Anaplasma phagocytophilum str. Annie]KJZ98830.1 hypothetical protein APHCR_0296 [Anaplasma phagocytophilum str. CR1007]KKA00455.1 hypothetical protein APHDU1_0088 [Anaplasma phagocytophilum]